MPSDKELLALGQGMTDFGLTNASDASDIGKPGHLLGEPSALEAALLRLGSPQQDLNEAIQNRPTTRDAARQVFTNPLTAILSALSVGTGIATGGATGALHTIGGVMQGIQNTHALNMEEYSGVLEQANAAVENRQKLAAGVRALLGQQPDLFAGEDPQVIGEAAFPGMGLSLDPRSKLQASKVSASRKFQMDAVIDLMKQAESQTAKKSLARMALSLTGMDLTKMPVEVYDGFWRQNGEFTDEQLAKWFGQTGVTAGLVRQQSGRLPYEVLQFAPQDQDTTPFERWTQLNTKIQSYINEQTANLRHVDLETAAQEALDETEYSEWQREQQKIAPELSSTESFRAWLQAANSVSSFMLFNPELGSAFFGGRSPDEVITGFAMDAVDAAKEASRQQVDLDFQTLFLRKKQAISTAPQNADMTLSEVVEAAKRLAVEDLRSRGAVRSIPPQLQSPSDLQQIKREDEARSKQRTRRNPRDE